MYAIRNETVKKLTFSHEIEICIMKCSIRHCLGDYFLSLLVLRISHGPCLTDNGRTLQFPTNSALAHALVIGGWGISCEIFLRWKSEGLTDDTSTLGQLVAWCRPKTSHYLSQCWPRSIRHMASLGPIELTKLIYTITCVCTYTHVCKRDNFSEVSFCFSYKNPVIQSCLAFTYNGIDALVIKH